MAFPADAFLLGISSGPACLASCGPVLVPALAAERRTAGGTALVLVQFLAGRLAGYLCFAAVAWFLSFSLAAHPRGRALAFGLSDLGLAALLAGYAFALPRSAAVSCGRACSRYRNLAPALIGLVTGLTLCPPFVAAGLRATQEASLAGVLLFFVVFFLGTSICFVPSVSVGLLRRFEAVAIVARFTLFLLAAYYGYLAVVVLGRELSRG
jgi:hypothetical protein